MILAMLILQATTADPAVLPDIPFDLRKPPTPAASGNDIVVTGRRANRRLDPLPDLPDDPMLPRAEMRVFGNAKLGVTVDQMLLPNGLPSNRAMVTLKMAF